MATYSSTLAWKIPWMVERGRPMGLQRVRHDWATSLHFTPTNREQTHPWKSSDNRRAKGKPCSISRADSKQYNTNQTFYRMSNSTSLWTRHTRGRYQKQEELWSYSLLKRDHRYSKSAKMRQQINMLQTKEQDKNLQEILTENISNLSKKEFGVMTVNMIQDRGSRMEAWIKKIQEKFTKT